MKILIIFITILLSSSCKQFDYSNRDKSNNYIIRDFLLEQNRNDGTNYWLLKSEEAKYDQFEKSIISYNPTVKIFDEDKERYLVVSNELRIYNNGEFIRFIGNVNVVQIPNRNIEITSNILEWTPSSYLFNFKGNTKLSRNFENERNFDITTDNISFNSLNGLLSSDTKTTANSLVTKYTQEEYLTADSLNGNIKKGYIKLINCKYIRPNKIISTSNICKINWSPDKSTNKNKIITQAIQMFSDSQFVESAIFIGN